MRDRFSDAAVRSEGDEVAVGRRSIVASFPNQLDRPSAVVSADQTFAGGWAISTTRSMRSGNHMTASSK